MSALTREELAARLAALPEGMLIDAVIDGLSAAGGDQEWEAETIESVLAPFKGVVAKIGMPWVGSTADDAEQVNAWRLMTPANWDLLCLECWEAGHNCEADEDEDEGDDQ